MSSFTQKLLNQGLQWGMMAAQGVLSHPTAGPLMMKTITQLLELRTKLMEARENLIKNLSLASYHDQKEMRRQLRSLEKKIERMERRLKDVQSRAKKATAAAQAAEAALAAVETSHRNSSDT